MKCSRKILVVEDDVKIAQVLLDYLRNEGFEALSMCDGRQAVHYVERTPPLMMILDLNLPGLDGVGVCQAIREFSDVPILMLTARVDEMDRLLGLDSGADDYVCKPFSPLEVMARVRATVRRVDGQLKTSVWVIDDAAQIIRWHDQPLDLTTVEFRMLSSLLQQPGRVFSRTQLLDKVHEDQRSVSDRAIDSHVKNLRRKLRQIEPDNDSIASVYGAGYRFDPPE